MGQWVDKVPIKMTLSTTKLLLLLVLVSSALSRPQESRRQGKVLVVSSQSSSTSEIIEERAPFIVLAATVKNDDPNEALIPTRDSDNGQNKPTFNLLSNEDLERQELRADVIEASGREGTGFIPTNDNGPDKPGFKLLTSEDLARENGGDVNAYDDYDDVVVIGSNDEEPLLKDIPRDTSGPDEPFFKLPLPDEEEEDYYSDVVVVSRDDRDRGEGRQLNGFPTNDNGPDKPGFKLLSKEDLARENGGDVNAYDDYDDVVVIGSNDEEPLLKDIPRDTSGSDEPFFKLPLPDEGEEDYYSDVVVVSRDDRDRGEGRQGGLHGDIPRDTSGADQPFFRLPLPDEGEEDEYSDVEIIEAGDDDNEEGRSLDDIPRDHSRFDQAGPRLPKALDLGY